jgi:hypothetical protein
MSPTYFQFAKEFFAFPNDQQERGSIILRQPNPRWLAAFGVKYIIIDAPMKEMIQQKIMPLAELGNLYLYELIDANIGQYSPTQIIKLVNSKQILEKLKNKQFDPEIQIVTDIELPNKLVKATNSKIIINKGYFNIVATSKGDSVILLPVEYSHCLTIKSNISKSSKPILFRANITQTGIFFHHHLNASIRYFTGPFYHSTCRLRDAKDFEKSSVILA